MWYLIATLLVIYLICRAFNREIRKRDSEYEARLLASKDLADKTIHGILYGEQHGRR